MRKICSLIQATLLLAVAPAFPQLNAAESAPSLSIEVNPTPTLVVTGTAGSTYRVEYREDLKPTTPWSSFAEITLTQSSEAVPDTITPYGSQRYYRSVSLPSEPGLLAGESYAFTTIDAGTTNRSTLIVSSAQSGWLISHSMPAPPEGAIRQVALSFERLGPISSRITAIIPGDGGAILATTNQFLLLYSASGGGTVQWTSSSGGPAHSALGFFSQDYSLVGQDIAPAQLTASESYTFAWNDVGAIMGEDVVIVNDAQNGIFIQSGEPASAGLQSVHLNYQKLSPICATLEVGVPNNPAAG